MKSKTLTIGFSEVDRPDQLDAADRELLEAATAALPNSYSPYSKFKVAAAARLEDGTIVAAANTENAAYPMCICAEPNAMAAAAALRPGMPVVTMAITVKAPTQTLNTPASPCGSCRQILSEHEGRFGHSLRLILRGETGPIYVFDRAGDLLPFGFSGELL
ncbi:cytidine deaminase [Neolewinella xylanilytica]|uniref:Cytidine deaminase n=1 Tax=Neolewinella xylanilytica TaxID=1514080 RepID=A0A2S6I1X4_9BACT|nr:cytidine deaminase [Neolewinella xylanilytica]PPK85176.1 cytidine deaminase [Neolewinella xylanilytica]